MRFFSKAAEDRKQFRKTAGSFCVFGAGITVSGTGLALFLMNERSRTWLQVLISLGWLAFSVLMWICHLAYMHDDVTLKRFIRGVAAAALCSVVAVHIAFSAVARPAPEETLNFAVGVYAWKEEDHRQTLEDQLTKYGIRQVNYSYFDIAEFERYTQYLSTYGVYDADVLILDKNVAQQMMAEIFLPLSDADRQRFQSASYIPLRFSEDGNGVLLHVVGDDTYNQSMEKVHQWLLFQGDEEYDFAIYINGRSKNAEAAMQAIATLLSLWTK